MTSVPTRALVCVAALGGVLAAACSDSSTAPSSAAASVSSALLSTAYTSAVPGYDRVSSSYNASGNTGSFGPGGQHGDRGNGGPGFGGFMGGGLGDEFAGRGGFGPGFGRGAFGDPRGNAPITTCTFAAGTGRITCAPTTVDGLTISRYAIYTTAAGTAQQAFDTATDKAVTHVEVSGTTTFTPHDHHGFGPGFGPDSAHVSVASATNTVSTVSDRTVTGLASGSTQRTVNGTSAGTESTTGKLSDSTSFTAKRTMGDTTTGLVIPVKTGAGVYPTAGTVVRSTRATVTLATGTTKNTSRREVVTYDGSATAKVVIVQNDTTRNCTMPLPRGRLSCS
ncbi:MAG: hypothetical protein M3154_04880 [Candidatus Eremiobacteraeota bacterium]|nr:hypothetical protein [Candidatus Eremiobacteraeota bacterium]